MILEVKTMEEMIAFCGIDCAQCPAYIATQKDDDKEREEVAELWSSLFNMKLAPRDINCDGCLPQTGRHFRHCRACEIRSCAQGRSVKNCASCDAYACTQLREWFVIVPRAKLTLDKIRGNL